MSEKDAKGKEGDASPTPDTAVMDPMDMINSLKGTKVQESVKSEPAIVVEQNVTQGSQNQMEKLLEMMANTIAELSKWQRQDAGITGFHDVDEPDDAEPEAPKPARRFELMIDEQDNNDSNGDVFVGLNGYAYLIKRGKKVIVPEGVLNVLRESIIDKIQRNRDTGEERIVSVPRFSIPHIKEIIDESV